MHAGLPSRSSTVEALPSCNSGEDQPLTPPDEITTLTANQPNPDDENTPSLLRVNSPDSDKSLITAEHPTDEPSKFRGKCKILRVHKLQEMMGLGILSHIARQHLLCMMTNLQFM